MADSAAASTPPRAGTSVMGYLVLTVETATGKGTQGTGTWSSGRDDPTEAFVRAELRGGARVVKDQTSRQRLAGGEAVTWREELRMEVPEASTELRLMLCRDKFSGTKRGASIMAACGIYMSDILDACPIDKHFDLYKPNGAGEGGSIHVMINFEKDSAAGVRMGALPTVLSDELGTGLAAKLAPLQTAQDKGGKNHMLRTVLLAAATVAAGAAFALQRRPHGGKPKAEKKTKKEKA